MKSSRAALFAGLCLVTAVPAVAAPLCRDSKGLFTPCPPGAAPTHHGTPPRATRDQEARASRTPAAVPKSSSRPVVARTRLCRDGKGLFTPCPR